MLFIAYVKQILMCITQNYEIKNNVKIILFLVYKYMAAILFCHYDPQNANILFQIQHPQIRLENYVGPNPKTMLVPRFLSTFFFKLGPDNKTSFINIKYSPDTAIDLLENDKIVKYEKMSSCFLKHARIRPRIVKTLN